MDPSLPQTPAQDRTAKAVQQFYEDHPYPPPEQSLDSYRERWADLNRRRADYHRYWPTERYHEDRSVLVAGCGTSQAAKYAIRWPKAQVTGIDVSATSISCTEELKGRYGLDNLALRQLPVESAAELGRQFDLVVCTGVLHHLPDPDAGLHALGEVTKSGGAVNLMVYAPYGRAGVYLLQDYCRRLGIGTSSREIRELASSLQALPQDHPIAPLLRSSPDFNSEAGLADALLHPQDRAYSVPQVLDFLGRAGLQFGRWVRQAPYLPFCGAISTLPHHRLLAQLDPRAQYAALELFRGTMLRHSAIVYRGDHPGEAQPIRFGGDDWLEYVPIRLPETICVEERLPPGAAGVLINRGHTYTDIYLPIDTEQKGMFDAIDGQRTISEILEVALPGSREARHLEVGAAFFQRLWYYDQVVFDASRSGSLSMESGNSSRGEDRIAPG